MNVAETDVHQGLQLLANLWNVLQQREGVRNRHLQQVGDRVALVLHSKCLVVVALAPTDFTLDVDIRQEVHFNATLTVTLAGFASPASNVEREASCLVAALA